MEAPSSSDIPLPFMFRESAFYALHGSLPLGWSSYVDPTTHRVYYYKEEDGQMSWEHPDPEFLPPEWSVWHDARSRQMYYYNKNTNCSEWVSSSARHYVDVFMRMAISGEEFSVECVEDSPVLLLQEVLSEHFLPLGWTRRVGCYLNTDTGYSQVEHPLGDITFRIMKEDNILRPGDLVHANTNDDPYIAVIIKLPTLEPGSRHVAVAAYDAAEGGTNTPGYMSIAVGDEVEILAPAEVGDSQCMHLKYYYGRVRDNEGWFAWDVFDSSAQADTPTE